MSEGNAEPVEAGGSTRRVVSVVLNYNSDGDLRASIPQLLSQSEIQHSVIVVDNASNPDCVARMRKWIALDYPNSVVGTESEVAEWIRGHSAEAILPARIFLVFNHENRGYSAGNNVGIRLAIHLRAQAVLVANPDMRFQGVGYAHELLEVLLQDERNAVVASRIVGLDGRDQSPLRESDFWEELLWPRRLLGRLYRPTDVVLPVAGTQPVEVPKVSGCCLLLRTSFLEANGLLDEGVFLYCEEPILSARVRIAGGRILFVPTLTAIHAHVRSEKANASGRMLIFIQSRLYYLTRYSGYGPGRLRMLCLSYTLLAMVHRVKLSALQWRVASGDQRST